LTELRNELAITGNGKLEIDPWHRFREHKKRDWHWWEKLMRLGWMWIISWIWRWYRQQKDYSTHNFGKGRKYMRNLAIKQTTRKAENIPVDPQWEWK
jgi:hypothetical protein